MRRVLTFCFVTLVLTSCSNQSAPVSSTESSNSSPAIAQQQMGSFTASISAPERTPTGFSGLMVNLKAADGSPVSGADVSAKTSMPQHSMNGPDMVGQQRAPGQYWLAGNLMKGQWRIDLSVKEASGATSQKSLDITVP